MKKRKLTEAALKQKLRTSSSSMLLEITKTKKKRRNRKVSLLRSLHQPKRTLPQKKKKKSILQNHNEIKMRGLPL
jgi:hypothetical protein